MQTYADFHRRSLVERDAFWAEQARRIDWQTPPQQICDTSRPPFARWFVGGRPTSATTPWTGTPPSGPPTARADLVSTETNQERIFSFAELQAEVECMAAILREQGVARGDRVLIYMPMIPEAAFAMLACARIGAIHSVVFGGFASGSLATRIEDATPTPSSAPTPAPGRQGRALQTPARRSHPALGPQAGQGADGQPGPGAFEPVAAETSTTPRPAAAPRHPRALRMVGVEQPPATSLYTSGTTGKPKGVQRDTGGYAVALAASMDYVYGGKAGETYFSTSDIGWVVGHSYIIYGPLIAGMATIMYEGLPIQPDAGVWWSLVERFKVTVMFSAPTAVRVLKKHDPAFLKKYDLSSRALFLAGEPLDEPTARWISESLGVPIIDNYWQTETGWPLLSVANHILAWRPCRHALARPVCRCLATTCACSTKPPAWELTGADQKGVLTIRYPLPPGCPANRLGRRRALCAHLLDGHLGQQVYSTFDWGVRDADGYTFILGRTDDVINVAGHRLGTREIEESISSHPAVAEVAVVGGPTSSGSSGAGLCRAA